MKKLLLITGAALALCAPAAFAVEQGVDLTWGGCPGEPTATNNANFNCTANQLLSLYGTFKTDRTLPLWFSSDVKLEFEQQGAATLSPFYRYGTCNSSSATGRDISGDPDPGGTGLCGAFNNVEAELTAIAGYAEDLPNGGHGRFQIVVARQSANPKQLDAKKNYFAFRLILRSNNRTTCTGCGQPATVTWNFMTMHSNDGTDYIIEGPDKKSQVASLNCTNPPCEATPTNNRTWGQLKSLYR